MGSSYNFISAIILRGKHFEDMFHDPPGNNASRLNVDKAVILTNEAQPPNTLVARDCLILKSLDRYQGQKWLGCILTACGNMMQPDAAR